MKYKMSEEEKQGYKNLFPIDELKEENIIDFVENMVDGLPRSDRLTKEQEDFFREVLKKGILDKFFGIQQRV